MSIPTSSDGSARLERILREKSVLVCVGSGGVGKTTVAASLGLRASALGRRVVVLTIDPAKRLANALGLSTLGNQETLVDPGWVKRAGIESDGELWAMMLDLKRSWDDLIHRSVPPDRAEAILANRFYQTLSSALAGSQEYIAMEKLYELYSRGDWDLLILDTPPTAHALDFLDAPNRILDFLDNEAIRMILGPALAAGRVGMRLFNFGTNYIARGLAKFTGGETLQELANFMVEIRGTYDHFKDRAAKVKTLLASDETSFLLVTSPHSFTVGEAIHFHDLLVQERMPIGVVVANRVHRDFLGSLDTPPLPELQGAMAAGGLDDGGAPPLSSRLLQTVTEARALSRLDHQQINRLFAAVSPTPVLRVPRFESAVYDLPALWNLGGHLLAKTSKE